MDASSTDIKTYWNNCMATAIDFFEWSHRESEVLLACLVTGDEFWLHFWILKTKKASKLWKMTDEPTLKKIQNHTVGGKNHVHFLLGFRESASHGIFVNEKSISSITQFTHFDMLMKLRQAVEQNQLGKLMKRIFASTYN